MTATLVSAPLAFERDLRASDLRLRAAGPITPPSGTVLAVVRQFGEAEERDDGLTLYRLAPRRLADADIRAMLGAERERALDVALLWDDREEELIEVLDDAALRPRFSDPRSYAELKLRSDRRHRAAYARAA